MNPVFPAIVCPVNCCRFFKDIWRASATPIPEPRQQRPAVVASAASSAQERAGSTISGRSPVVSARPAGRICSIRWTIWRVLCPRCAPAARRRRMIRSMLPCPAGRWYHFQLPTPGRAHVGLVKCSNAAFFPTADCIDRRPRRGCYFRDHLSAERNADMKEHC
jgi:hypothetical protein